MKKPVRRRGYAQGGTVDTEPDDKTPVPRSRLPGMTRPNTDWVPKELPKATPFGGFGNEWKGKPMAKGGKVKKVVRRSR